MAKRSIQTNSDFKPSAGLKNTHVQTVFSSAGPRKWSVSKDFSVHRSKQQEMILDCGEDSRLQGFHNLAGAKRSNKLLILIHGWEGCHESIYMLSAAQTMLSNGVDVFRLNLRDHGATHHLNRGLFYSTLLEEVLTAIELLQHKLEYKEYHLAGYSLGGNFAMRVATSAQARAIRLNKAIAFCPAIHAGDSNIALHEGRNWLYHYYFVRRWKRSLLKKASHWPQYNFADELSKLKNLNDMNQALIPRYTEFENVNDYFDAYAISGDKLADTIAPCYLHFATDDPIIPVSGVGGLPDSPMIDITITDYGGHCGFIQNWQGQNWQNKRLLQLIK